MIEFFNEYMSGNGFVLYWVMPFILVWLAWVCFLKYLSSYYNVLFQDYVTIVLISLFWPTGLAYLLLNLYWEFRRDA